ncbi:MAG: hypothetical protein U0X73_17260 [Thermoanaerobaculia bacterium]
MSDRRTRARAPRRCLLTAVALAVLLAAPGTPLPAQLAQGLERRADAGLARAKSRAGGPLWDSKRTLHLRYRIEIGGVAGSGESWTDLATGRYLERRALGSETSARGFDGERPWTRSGSASARGEEDADAVAAAFSEAYRRSLSYWYIGRRPGHRRAAGEKVEGTRQFSVMRCEPERGLAFELWIDMATGWIDRMLEPSFGATRTDSYADYRKVEGVMLPFEIRRTTGDPRTDSAIHVESATWNAPLDDALFAAPAGKP